MKILNIVISVLIFSATATFAADCTERFSWLPSTGSNILGYKIYYGQTDGGPYPNEVDFVNPAPVDGRIYGEVPGLVCGIHYYFVATTYSDTEESAFSIQVDTQPVSSDGGGEITKVFGSASDADFAGTIQDTFINLNTENNAASQSLNTYTWPENMVANAIIMKVDLSGLPPGAQIQNASIQLYAYETGGDNTYTISAHEIINNNPDLSLATGYTYDGINGWSANTSCYNNVPMAQANISSAESVNNVDLLFGYKNWDITAMTRKWQSNPDLNYGFMLNSDNNASSNSFRFFASSEAANTSHRPRLVVTYTLDATPQILNISIK